MATIPPFERRELRSVIRAQFKVLRTEVKQRENELMAEAEGRLVDKYRDEDKRIDDLNWRIKELADAAQREVEDLMKQHEDLSDGGRWHHFAGRISFNRVHRVSEDRTQLHRALTAGVKAQVRDALLALDRQEADLLKAIAMEALESDEAKAFLQQIPTVADLVPSKRLREIESAFDRERRGVGNA